MRASQLGVALKVRFDHRFPRDARGNPLPAVSVVLGCDIDGTPDARAAAFDALSKLETQAPQRQIEEWLAELSVIVRKRQEDEFSETLRLEAYAARLRRYPADVARHAVLGVTWEFWPSWSELERVCENVASPRRAMLLKLSVNPQPRPDEPQPGRLDRARAEAIIKEIYGEGEA